MPNPSQSSRRLGVLEVCGAGVLWGTGGLALKLVRRHCELSVITISAWRMGIAALALIAFAAVTGRRHELNALLSRAPRSAILAGLGTAAYQALYFGAVVDVGVSVATVISLGLAPVLATAFEATRARRLPARSQLLVLAIALAGLMAVASGGSHATVHAHPAAGIALAAAAGATYAFATAIAQPAAATATPLALASVSTGVGALVLAPVALLAGPPYATSHPLAIGWLLYLAVMSLAVAYSLFYAGLSKVSSSVALLGSLLEPVTAAGMAAVVLGERLGLAGVLGTVLILTAVAGIGLADEQVMDQSRELPPP